MPVYNEEKTLVEIVRRVQRVSLGKIKKELVIIDDGSKDRTKDLIRQLKKKYRNIISLEHNPNKGKGAALRRGFEVARGDFLVIQDGDLEYNPEDFRKLLSLLLQEKADVVYGSRLLGHTTGFSIPSHYYGNKFLSFMTKLFYGQVITDMETCYKMMRKDVVKSLVLKSNRFDIEPEITVKIIKKGYKILEVPIDYNCRSFEEGKKITWKDGIIALYTLLKYRFF